MVVIDSSAGVTEASLRERRGTKWNKHGEGVLAAWVADMDFTIAEPVRDAIAWSAEHSALGYGPPEDQADLFRAASTMDRRPSRLGAGSRRLRGPGRRGPGNTGGDSRLH